MTKPQTIADALLSGVQAYAERRELHKLAAAAGVPPSVLSRILKGGSVNVSTADKLLAVTGFEVRARKKRV